MIEKKFLKYYLYGYINCRNILRDFVKTHNEDSIINRKVNDTFAYFGIDAIPCNYEKWVWIISFFEVFFSIILVWWRFFVVIVCKFFVTKQSPVGLNLLMPLSIDKPRLIDMLSSLEGAEVTTVHIPFIVNRYKNNEIKLLSVISIKDICDSFVSSSRLIIYITRKYGKDDILFRSYSSFEYFLACRFIEKVESTNNIIYFSTYDRWGFLFCRAKSEVTFIQHGKLDQTTKLIRVGTPSIAYYISRKQKNILEDILFTSQVKDVRYRKLLIFTHNEVLNNNGKLNVLIVSAASFVNEVSKITEMIAKDTNVYVKPHPGERKLEIYDILEKKYGVILLDKADYPKADVVLSYNSTLAEQYEMVGIRTIRWDLLKDLSEVKSLVLNNDNKKICTT